MSIKVDWNFDLNKINLDLSKELNRVAQLIRKDHHQRLEKGDGVDGIKMRQLSHSTILRKRKSKDGRINANAEKILVATGGMRNLDIVKATRDLPFIEVHPGRIKKYKGTNLTQADVGYKHQYGIGVPVREWFGISEDAEARAYKLIEQRIEQEINRA